ncbi:hypothetical protein F4780DRAFT_284127 [Xylariomycetidae sp. FL0641]|nr:hypothetical protein F4780DRAFT_284127 [Xylariomycetidae sp. FL0641]
MTRNNLQDQLAWLLANVALSIPTAPALPSVRDQPADFTAPDAADTTVFFTPPTRSFSTDVFTSESPRRQLYPALPNHIEEQTAPAHGPDDLAEESQATRGRNLTRGDNMSRLSAKSGSKRPGLLLRQEQLPSPSPTAGSGSLSSEYTALLRKNSAKKRTSPRRQAPEASRENLLMTPGATLASNHVLDTIDLTNDSEETTPASVAFGSATRLWREDFASRPEPIPTTETTENSFEFGSDEMVWEEDHATRPAPLSTTEDSSAFTSGVRVWDEESAARPVPLSAKRGKKRKSDQISYPPPTTGTTTSTTAPDEFPDIYELLSDDENLQIRAHRSPTNSPTKRRLKSSPIQAPSRYTGAREDGTALRSRHTANISKQLSPVPERPQRHSPARTPRKDGGHAISRTPSGRLKGSRLDERVIQDSDDEFSTPASYMGPDSPAFHSVLHKSPLAREHPGSLFAAAHKTPSKKREPTLSREPKLSQSPRLLGIDDKTLSESFKSPLRQTGFTLSQNSAPASQPDPPISEEDLSNILFLFLEQPSMLEKKRFVLKESEQQNRAAYRKSLLEGNTEPRGRLKREKDKILQQQTALEALSTEFRSYEDLKAKRDALIARIDNAYAHNLDTEDDEARLEELDGSMKRRQQILKAGLPRAGIHSPRLFEATQNQPAQAPVAHPVVHATQPVRPMVPPDRSGETTMPPPGSQQVILQTQFAQGHEAMQPDSEPDIDDIPIPRSGGRRRRALPPSHNDGAAGSQPPFTDPRSRELTRTPTRRKQHTPIHPAIEEELGDFDDFLEDVEPPQDLYRARPVPVGFQSGGPQVHQSPNRSTRRTDAQSDYSDDVDMSELAQEFELQQSSSENTRPRSERTILAETSANAGVHKEKSPVKRVQSSSSSITIAPELKKFPWYKDVKRALKDRFRMTGFRTNQLEAINATLAGNDAFILMPTGGGKSLCYQLPAVVKTGKTKGITVVVSPLLSLMQDQVDHLRKFNIHAASFSGDTNAGQRSLIMENLRERFPENHLQLLYVTPEMINKSQAFSNILDTLYRNNKLARLVIDEAHCVSQWGHDFRPDYKELGVMRKRFPGVPLMALTATATQNVIMDVKHNLGMRRCEEFSQSFNRPNLYYEVQKKEKNNVGAIAELINSKFPRQTGIVYTLSRKSAENIAQKLQEQGIAAHHYHANVPVEDKTQIQKDWQKGTIKVVVATIAFGMGIDKPDVRFVIHQSIPKSLEGYYQETGRAGRDGNPSSCYLFFNYGDVTSLRKMISDSDGNEEQKERQRNMLGQVTAFCDNQSDCRRVEILRYFGESFSREECHATCDNCKSNDVFEQQDFTKYAVAALEIIRAQRRLTVVQCTDYMMGKKKKTEFDNAAEPFHGIAKSIPKHEVHRIIDRLVMEDALKEENVINKRVRMAVQYFRLGRKAQSFLNNQRKLLLTTRSKTPGSRSGASKTQSRPVEPAAPATRREPSRAKSVMHPSSTLVSSPAQPKTKKKKGKAVATVEEDDEDSGMGLDRYESGYARDGFVVDDEEDDDDFEIMPRSRTSRRSRHEEPVGPPISRDSRMSDTSLSDIHRDISRSFLEEAKTLEERIRRSKSLRSPLFTEVQLREMSLSWTLDLNQMRSIPGINVDKVDRYGEMILPLIRHYHRQYQEIMGEESSTTAGPAGPAGQHHDPSIVDLVTTDEDELMDDIDDDEDGEASGYFQAPNKASMFQDQLEEAGKRGGGRARSTSTAAAPKSKNTWRGGKPYARKASKSSKTKASGTKKRSYGSNRRVSDQSSRSGSVSFQQGGRSSSSKSKPQGVGHHGIGLMKY